MNKETDEIVTLCEYKENKVTEFVAPENPNEIKRMVDAKIKSAQNSSSSNFENRIDLYSIGIIGDIQNIPADWISYDSKTDFSKAILPEDFNPQIFMENGKKSAIGIETLHARGITGKGIKIAIIDAPLADHDEYHEKIKHYEQIGIPKGCKGAMHGSCVTSLAVGNKCGAAPDAEVYYIAVPFYHQGKNYRNFVADGIKRLREINQSLPHKDKITAVSISACSDSSMVGYKEFEEQRKLAEKEGLEIITCSLYKEKGLSVNGYNRDLTKDTENTDNIILIEKKIDSRIQDDWFDKDSDKTLLLPCDHKTMASELGYKEYMHAARGGFSWLPPQLVGIYALAKQVDRGCRFKDFYNIALRSGHKTEKGIVLNTQRCIKLLEQEKILKNIKMPQMLRHE